MSPPPPWIDPGKVVLNNLLSTSMNSSDNGMKYPLQMKFFPFATRLTLIQTAVHAIPELRIVETMEEFLSLSSFSTDSTMESDSYFTLLHNACIRSDKSLKQKPSVASIATYQHSTSVVDFEEEEDEPEYAATSSLFGGIDMPSDDFYSIITTNFKRQPHVQSLIPRKPSTRPKPGTSKSGPPKPRYSGPIYLPTNIYNMLMMKPEKLLSTTTQLPKLNIEVLELPTHMNSPLRMKSILTILNNESPCTFPPQDDFALEYLMTNYSNQYSVDKTHIYYISKHFSSSYGSLVDRGTNGGLAGADVHVLE